MPPSGVSRSIEVRFDDRDSAGAVELIHFPRPGGYLGAENKSPTRG
jgi:hypothetical protein